MRLRVQVGCTLLALCLASAALAAGKKLIIDDPAWIKLTDVDRAKIISDLKAAGAIGPDDTIEYTGGTDNTISEKNTGGGLTGVTLDAARSIARSLVCRVKNLTEEEACAKKAESERAACKAAEKARNTKAKSACK